MTQDLSGPFSGSDCTIFFDALLNVGLSWEWDKRFNTALAHIRIAEEKTVRKILENHFSAAWESTTIDAAPEKVQLVLNQLGGIMTNQLFYAAGLPHDEIIFCAWWPWNNGHTISVRIGTTLEGSSLLDPLASSFQD